MIRAALLLLLPSVLAGPCDLYARAGTPCAAAHSVVRALLSGFDLPLYRLLRSSDNATLDIRPVTPGGIADGRTHARFCDHPVAAGYPARAACVISVIFDQTGNGNHLLPATPAINNPAFDLPVNATRHAITVNGSVVYGAFFETGMGYRAQNTTEVARGNDPETIYMVTSGTHLNSMCCFDYGSSENRPDDHSKFVNGAMEAVYFGTGYGGGGKGPWIGADMENGIYGGPYVAGDRALRSPFVTAMVKGGSDGFAVKGGDASGSVAGGRLKRYHDGPRPHGYQPMHKTGAIILGVGGDNARMKGKVGVPGLSVGTFYEGLLTAGLTTDDADDAVQADIVAAGYGS